MTEIGFGDLLRRHRMAANLTQEALAERAGVSTRGISDLERGARELPRKDTLRLLLQALDLSQVDRAAMIAAARRPPTAKPAPMPAGHAAGIPIPLTPLIGREADVATVAHLLVEPGVRLLTLTGPGGTGKTRLALAVADRVAISFPDGVIFVPLAPLADPALVAAAIALVLGVREAVGQSLPAAITAYLRDKRMLLILDNCEHVLAAAPLVTELLGGCRALTILATSRVRLRLSGEREVPVLPLALPQVGGARGHSDLAHVPAVQLLTARAQDANAAFALTEENAPVIAEICRRLDGLPLALELAAARLKILSPAALLARLDRRLPLLTGGAHDLPGRQQTLRQTIAWSHDLLGEEERILFRRMGVFAGGWTLEAAEAVANAGGGLDVFEELSSLVDKNLILLADHASDEPRFTMLETIREFALECLAADPDEERTVHLAHGAYFATLALAAWDDLTVGSPIAVNWVRSEEANLRVMLTFLLDTNDIETALRLIGGSMSEYWTISGGQFSEARGWLDRALRQGRDATPAARAWGLYGLTILAVYQGDLVAARRASIEGLALARAAGDSLLAALSPLVWCVVEEYEGRRPFSEAILVEAVAAARAVRHPGTLGWVLQAFGRQLLYAGDLNAAKAAFAESLMLFQACDGIWGACDGLISLAAVATAQGDLTGAARLFADSLRLRLASSLLADSHGQILGVSGLALLTGNLDAAARLLGANSAYITHSGYEGLPGIVPHPEQIRQDLLAQLGVDRFERSWAAGQALAIDEAQAEALALAEAIAANRS